MSKSDIDRVREVLAEVKARASNATEGPWDMSKREPGVYDVLNENACLRPLATCEDYPPYLVGGYNAEFIAAARTDVPDLLKMLEVALEGLDRIEDVIGDDSARWIVQDRLKSIAAIAEGQSAE